MRQLLLIEPTGGSTVHTARCVRYRKKLRHKHDDFHDRGFGG